MVPASGCSVQRVGTDIGSLLKDLPRHFLNLLIQVFWSVLVQLRQAEEILEISFHTEHVGQQNLVIMIPEPNSDGAAGSRQHSSHAIQVDEDVGYPL